VKSSRCRAVNFIKLLFRLAPRSCLKWPIMGCPMEKWRWLIRMAGTRKEEDAGGGQWQASLKLEYREQSRTVNRTARSN
jgi:hypothetical protein